MNQSHLQSQKSPFQGQVSKNIFLAKKARNMSNPLFSLQKYKNII